MTFVTAENSGPAENLAARSWLERLDPRTSVGAATGWLIAAVSLGLALAASAWVGIVPTAMAVSFRYHHATAKQTGDNRCNDQLEFHNWSSSSTLVYPVYEHPAE
jgi:hypothetical protein